MVQLFVRFGLSPDLLDLFTAGQSHLGSLINSAPEVDLFNTSSEPDGSRLFEIRWNRFSGRLI